MRLVLFNMANCSFGPYSTVIDKSLNNACPSIALDRRPFMSFRSTERFGALALPVAEFLALQHGCGLTWEEALFGKRAEVTLRWHS
jgi:hypothetical protein